jgi:DNA-binding response OmpR family regulator
MDQATRRHDSGAAGEDASAQAVDARPTRAQGCAPARPLPPVFVVEDDPAIATLITALLNKLGLANPVEYARDSTTAIEALAAGLAHSRLPILILLDLHLLHGTGFDVLRWSRDQSDLSDVPVVMLTGSAALDEVNEAQALGVASYLVKPVGFEALADVVRSLPTRWALLAPEHIDG